MKKSLRTLLSAALIGALSSAAIAQGPSGTASQTRPHTAECGDAVCSQVIVQLHPGESIEAVNAAAGTSTINSIPSRDLFLLKVPPQASTQGVQTWLRHDERVAWAEMNHMVVAPNGGTQSFFLSATLNDYTDQLPLAIIGADAARDWASGRRQIVAVLDTGVDPDHPRISGRLAKGGFNYIDNNDNIRDIGAGDMVGHGTMVSGLVLRVAPQARILPMRVLNGDGVGASFYVAQAMYDAMDRGATIINISLGSIRPTQVIEDAAQAAHARGVLVVAAAGNFDRSEPVFYPAAFETVLSVAGTDWGDAKAEFSDYGTWIDIAAPAVQLASTFPGNAYATSSGNSMAAALISGSAAVIRSHDRTLTREQISTRLKASVADINALNPEYSGLLGAGRLDVLNAVSQPAGIRSRQ